MRAIVISLILSLITTTEASLTARTTGDVIRCAADVSRMAFVEEKMNAEFELTCTVLLDSPSDLPDVSVEDESGATILRKSDSCHQESFMAGDRINVRGVTTAKKAGAPCAKIISATKIAKAYAPSIATASGEEIESGRYDYRPVRIHGSIIDYSHNSKSNAYTQLSVDCGGTAITTACRIYDASKIHVGSHVSAVGIVFPGCYSIRRFKGRLLGIDNPMNITISDRQTADPFSVPCLDEFTLLGPSSIQRLGRRRATGTVMAVWGENLLLHAAGRRPVKVDIAHQPMPDFGQRIEVSGLTDTDLYQLCLCRAIWRPASVSRENVHDAATEPEAITLIDIPNDESALSQKLVGRTIRLQGTVFRLADTTQSDTLHGDCALLVQVGKNLITVDTSANPGCLNGVSIGCTVSVTGVCVLEAEHWRSNVLFTRILDYRIVPRFPGDVIVTARPPWWTTGKLLAVIGSLLASLMALMLWNVTLKRIVKIKSRELADGEISRAETAVKVYERTRLAVELHDSVSQSLTGVSMEIRAAQKAKNPEGLGHHLNMATLSLESCRSDLRDCLWDLRNLTLDEDSMEDAIRKTLAPRLGNAALAIRFNVDRELFTDNTAHTILRILRELATNAVRHGKATSIKVAGSIENGKLLFSLRDNGCGFDPATAPSMSEGHFGIQGIRDRINILDGTMDIESALGKGTRVTITINLPTEICNT